MRNNIIILLILIGVIFFSCQSKFKLDSDKNIRDTFSKSEIKEIGKMIRFVDKMVLSNSDSKDINQAYRELLNKLDKTFQSNQYIAPLEEEEKYQFLESLDSTVYREFWHMSNGGKWVRYKDSIYTNQNLPKSLVLNPFGRYMNYVKKTGENDTFFKSLNEAIEISGDMSPSMVLWFPQNHQKFDFTIPKNRLWVVVFILRMEEHLLYFKYVNELCE